ncbi:hypothetical protein F4810DRAFT_686948 [Camillea tinctor]|nr:hypothetical protein F4810DRAFT_686948 [Camillea tinctor]
MQMAVPPSGPPYRSDLAVVGGIPVPDVDDPIAAVFVFLFLCSAAAHMTILQVNKRRGLKFLFSGMLFVLCMLRSVALAMRMAWASNSTSTKVAIAANILTQTGSVLVCVINLFLTQRIVRAYHGDFGWHQATRVVFRFLIACVVSCLIMVITVTVQSFYTLDPGIRQSDRDVQLFAGTYLAVLAFLPVPIVLLAALLPRNYHIDKFGTGRWRTKLCLLLFTSLVATLGAAFRIGTNFAPRLMRDPAWYHSRTCYYCFNFVTDLAISTAYLLSRFDQRFIIPNGARGPGDYRTAKLRPPPMSSTFSSSSATLHASSGSDCEKGKGKGKETDLHHHRHHHHHHQVKIKGGEDGIPEVPPLRFYNSHLAMGFPVINSEAEAFGPGDNDDKDGDNKNNKNNGNNHTDGKAATNVPARKDNAGSPGDLSNIVDKISNDDSSTDSRIAVPKPAHLIRGSAQQQQQQPHNPPSTAATLTADSNWPFDNTGVYGNPGFHGVLPHPYPPPPPQLSPLRRNAGFSPPPLPLPYHHPPSYSYSPPPLGSASPAHSNLNPLPPSVRSLALPNRDIPGYGRSTNFFRGREDMGAGDLSSKTRTRTL